MRGHLVPFDVMSRTVRAEYRVCGVFHIAVRVIADRGDHLVGVVTRLIALQRGTQRSVAVGILHDLFGVIAHGGYGSGTCDRRGIGVGLRRVKAAMHPCDIRHRPADIFCGNSECKAVDGFEQNAFCRTQSLSHSAVGRLTKITALRVLGMRLA